MQLHELKGSKNRPKKRVGRGGKRGTYSGKGQKGQKSRAGRKIRPAERDLISKFPKFRGSGNKKNAGVTRVVSLDRIASWDGERVNPELLVKKGILNRISDPAKILAGKGEFKKKIQVSGISVSQGARKIIEDAGGKIL